MFTKNSAFVFLNFKITSSIEYITYSGFTEDKKPIENIQYQTWISIGSILQMKSYWTTTGASFFFFFFSFWSLKSWKSMIMPLVYSSAPEVLMVKPGDSWGVMLWTCDSCRFRSSQRFWLPAVKTILEPIRKKIAAVAAAMLVIKGNFQ